MYQSQNVHTLIGNESLLILSDIPTPSWVIVNSDLVLDRITAMMKNGAANHRMQIHPRSLTSSFKVRIHYFKLASTIMR